MVADDESTFSGNPPKSLIATIVLTATVALLVTGFFIYRLWMITRKSIYIALLLIFQIGRLVAAFVGGDIAKNMPPCWCGDDDLFAFLFIISAAPLSVLIRVSRLNIRHSLRRIGTDSSLNSKVESQHFPSQDPSSTSGLCNPANGYLEYLRTF
ncbi:hypothetical protein Hypma_004718 [Hypsizygus marmoreus]|uniref:Uncharacterized protein n=1 Tax=Hypsizygus marmoreus TaxID=39966 RepID=A0A369J6H2_HYPMA|nr:hypothetical protein Hypma_004718 [Hypsizygus marmoreus]